MAQTDADRLEEKFATNTRIALLEDHYTSIGKQMLDMSTDIKALGKQVDLILATKVTDHTQIFALIKAQGEQIDTLKSQSNFWRWMSPTLAAIAGSTLTFLLINYLQNLR